MNAPRDRKSNTGIGGEGTVLTLFFWYVLRFFSSLVFQRVLCSHNVLTGKHLVIKGPMNTGGFFS
jgi:hypothetical protein